MTQQKGSTVKIILGFESTYKTAPAAGFQLPVNSCGLVATRPKQKSGTRTGSRNPSPPWDGNLQVGGPIVVPVDSLGMPYWLKLMFGAPTTTGTDPYTHEFKIAATMPSGTIEAQNEDLATAIYDQYLGLKVGGFSIEVGGDGELLKNIDLVGANHNPASSPFDATPTEITIAKLQNFQSALLEAGGSLSNARNFSLNVNFGLDTDQFVIGGQGVLGSLPEGDIEVTGNLKTLFESDALLTKAEDGTESSLKLTVSNGASSIYELELQELLFERRSVPSEVATGLIVDLNFHAYYSAGSEASAIVARVTNGVASY